MKKKFLLLFTPFLFSAFPVLQYFASNRKEVILDSIGVPLMLSFLLVVIIWIILRVLFKSSVLASISAVIVSVAFFSYGHFMLFLYANVLTHEYYLSIYRTYYLFAIIITITCLLVASLRKVKDPYALLFFLMIAGIYLVGSTLYKIVPSEVEKVAKHVTRGQNALSVDKSKITSMPDIYYIIPDRYANEKILRKYYSYDNSDFMNFLREKGFYVASDSAANFPKTHLSLASSLSLDYINYLSDQLGRDYSSYVPAFDMVENNKVANTLLSLGYKYYYFGDWWEPTRINRLADRNINLFVDADEFSRKFFETTAINAFPNRWMDEKLFGYSSDKLYHNMFYKFDELSKIGSSPSPKFIFVHMLMPHYPYVFDENCKKQEDKEGYMERERYIAELTCLNGLLKKTITSIFAHSKKPPVVILQSDEGPFKFDEMRRSGEGTDWTKVSQEALETHMKIINALYIPEVDKKLLYSSISPVNSFRLVFNTYFGTSMKLFDDRSYFIPNIDRPYDFYEVTNKLTVLKKQDTRSKKQKISSK